MYKVPGEEKFRKQPVVVLLKNDCSIRHIFCSIIVPLFEAKILEKHFRSSSFLEKLETAGMQPYLKWNHL